MIVEIVIPQHIDQSRPLLQQEPPDLVLFVPTASRLLWRELAPLLLQSDRRIARRVLHKLDHHAHWSRRVHRETKEPKDASEPSKHGLQSRQLTVRRRTPGHVRIALQPPSITLLETSWEGRLIHFEHQLIQAQTIAGYLSTLGGGYFMCHHFSTAVGLAREQQRMAKILNDSSMYYKCLINTAYNYIYAGQFDLANQVIDGVLASLVRERPLDTQVLYNMCRSARLFGKRVQRWARQHHERRLSKTVDDFARIRLVQDASTTAEVALPFRMAHTVS